MRRLLTLCCLAVMAVAATLDPLDDLARDFWTWRAATQPSSGDDIPRIERPAGWLPDWSRDAIAIVTIVGAGIQTTYGIAGRIFSALGDHTVNVIAIAQGSSECGISVVVAGDDVGRAVEHIHELIVAKGGGR